MWKSSIRLSLALRAIANFFSTLDFHDAIFLSFANSRTLRFHAIHRYFFQAAERRTFHPPAGTDPLAAWPRLQSNPRSGERELHAGRTHCAPAGHGRLKP